VKIEDIIPNFLLIFNKIHMENFGFQIPWEFYKDQGSPFDKKIFFSFAIQAQKKTFAQTLNNACNIPLSQLTPLCIKGELIFVQIPEDVYLVGLEDCINHLHGRIILAKGDKSLTHLDFCKKINISWNSLGPWRAIPLGKGFYEFAFYSLEDMRRVLIGGVLESQSEVSKTFCLN